MPHDNPDHPAIIAPPPLITLTGVVVGFILNWLLPLPFLSGIARWIASGVLVVVGIAFGFGALSAMRRAHTPVDPYEAPTALVTDGPYRFTRNPIYLGFAFITVSLACFANALWLILLLPFTLLVIDRGVILREEVYLERRFGEAYIAYKSRVRRWI